MHKLIDKQHTLNDRVFDNREQVLEHLLNYHAPDLEKGTAYELHDLLDIGDWELSSYCDKCKAWYGNDEVDVCDIPY